MSSQHIVATATPSANQLLAVLLVSRGRFGESAVPKRKSTIPKSPRGMNEHVMIDVSLVAYNNAASHGIDMPFLRGTCPQQSNTAGMVPVERSGDAAEAPAVAHGTVIQSRQRPAEERAEWQTTAQGSQHSVRWHERDDAA